MKIKTIKYILSVLVIIFAFTSCEKEDVKNENVNKIKSENEYLMDIYNKANNVFRQIQSVPDNLAIIEELDSVINQSKLQLNKKSQNLISRKFFSKTENIINQNDLDYYSENLDEFIYLTQNNCSEQYANYINKYFKENEICFTINDLILNDSLPNNEKISLILLLTYVENQFTPQYVSSLKKVNEAACGRAYNSSISRCNRNTGVGLAFSGLAAVGSGGLAAAIAISYVWAQDMMCRNDASEDYYSCVQ